MNRWSLVTMGLFIVIIGFLGGAWGRQTERPLIVFLCGGDPGRDPEVRLIAAGARQAARECGARVEVIGSDGNLQEQLVELRAAFDRQPVGICLSGEVGEDGLSSLVNQAIDQHILVTGFRLDMPHLRQRYRQQGFGFIGAEASTSGRVLVAAAQQRLGLKPGERILLLSPPAASGGAPGGRIAAMTAGFQSAGYEVLTVPMPAEWDGEHPLSSAAVEPFLATHLSGQVPVRLVIVEAPEIAVALAPVLAALRGSGSVELATYGLTPEVGAAIAAGKLAFAIDEQPWLQGYFAVLQVELTRRAGVAGMRIDTGAQVVGKAEIDGLAPLIARGIR